jgi:hypothetical protein
VRFRIHLMPGPTPSRILVSGLHPAGPTSMVLQYRKPLGLVDVDEQKGAADGAAVPARHLLVGGAERQSG